MKKLGITMIAAIAMMFATENVNAQTAPQEEQTSMEPQANAEDEDFVEIDVTALPQPVKDAVMTDFQAPVDKAWAKEKEGNQMMYKIEIDHDGEKKHLYADQEGNWIDKDEKKDKKETEY